MGVEQETNLTVEQCEEIHGTDLARAMLHQQPE
jgi:hypothetical protein